MPINIQQVLGIATQYYVFPTRPGSKAPATVRGHLDALKNTGSLPREKIKAWDTLFEAGANLAVSCKASGIFVIDWDAYKPGDDDALEWLDSIEDILGNTLTHKTQSGGEHYVFRYSGDYKLPGGLFDTIDIKHDGYVLWPPSPGYEAINDKPILKAPGELIDAIFTAADRTRKKVGATGSGGNMFASTEEALVSLSRDVHRHEALNRITMDLAKAHQSWTWQQIAAAARDIVIGVPGLSPDRKDVLLRADDGGELERSAKGAVKLMAPYENALAMLAAVRKDRQPPVLRPAPSGTVSRREIELEEAGGVPPSGSTPFDIDAPLSEPEELIPGFLHVGDLASVVGLTNVGKTSLTASWIVAMSAGDMSIVGMQEIPAPLVVLWVSPEDRLMAMQTRIKAASLAHGVAPVAPIHLVGKEVLRKIGPLVEAPGGADDIAVTATAEWLIEEVRRTAADLVILDPYTNFLAADENSSQVASAMIKAMYRVVEEAKTTCLYFAHTVKTPESKSDDFYRGDIFAQRGSGAAPAAVDAGATLTPYFGKLDKKNHRKLRSAAKSGDAPNLIDFSVSKLRWGLATSQIVYQIIGAEIAGFKRSVPCAFVVDKASAERKIDEWASALVTDTLALTAYARALIDRLGEGVHPCNGKETHEAMAGVEWWPQRWQAVQGRGKIMYEAWDYATTYGTFSIRVRNTEEGKTRPVWAFEISKVPSATAQ